MYHISADFDSRFQLNRFIHEQPSLFKEYSTPPYSDFMLTLFSSPSSAHWRPSGFGLKVRYSKVM